MKQRRRRPAWIAFLAVFAMILAGCSSNGEQTDPPPPPADGTDDPTDPGEEPQFDGQFVFGAVLPLSGPFGPVGQGSLIGLQAQAHIINAQGGILGREVVIEVRDSAGDGQQAVSAMRDLLASGEVHAVMSENLGPLSAAVIPVIAEEGIISGTTAGSSNVGDKDTYPTNFQFALLPRQQTQMMLGAAETLGVSRLGIIGFDDETGRGYADFIVEAAPDFGFEVVGSPQYFDAQATDYTAQLQVLRDAGAEVLVGNLFGAPIGVVGQGLLDLGWSDVRVVGTPGFAAAPLDAIVPQEAWDQILFANLPAGAYGTDGLSPEQQAFVDAIEATGNEVTTLLGAASTADVLTGMWYAYERAGVLDSAAAIEAMHGMADDPAVLDYPWLFFGGQSPRFSADYHYPELVDLGALTWISQVGERLGGAHPGQPIS